MRESGTPDPADEMERYLGRAPAHLDLAPARRSFENASVLVTGGGGSIGAALCRELLRLGAHKVTALDNSDHALIDVLETAKDFGGALREQICDVRDVGRLRHCVELARPDIVIHAAALKHVHMGERHPAECVLTNLVGVRNALEASIAAQASGFLLISSDKAAAAGSVMGACKRLGELYVAGRRRALAAEGRDFCAGSVRFGNVIGSKGSVAPLFARQIAMGGPLTVTHPDMRRYFMSLTESVRLILLVGAHMSRHPETATYLLEMGEPVRIIELAERMIADSGKSVEIKVTGVREGEKLDELLYDEHETIEPSEIPGVSRLRCLSEDAEVTLAEIADLERMVRTLSDDVIRHRTFALLDRKLKQGAARAS